MHPNAAAAPHAAAAAAARGLSTLSALSGLDTPSTDGGGGSRTFGLCSSDGMLDTAPSTAEADGRGSCYCSARDSTAEAAAASRSPLDFAASLPLAPPNREASKSFVGALPLGYMPRSVPPPPGAPHAGGAPPRTVPPPPRDRGSSLTLEDMSARADPTARALQRQRTSSWAALGYSLKQLGQAAAPSLMPSERHVAADPRQAVGTPRGGGAAGGTRLRSQSNLDRALLDVAGGADVDVGLLGTIGVDDAFDGGGGGGGGFGRMLSLPRRTTGAQPLGAPPHGEEDYFEADDSEGEGDADATIRGGGVRRALSSMGHTLSWINPFSAVGKATSHKADERRDEQLGLEPQRAGHITPPGTSLHAQAGLSPPPEQPTAPPSPTPLELDGDPARRATPLQPQPQPPAPPSGSARARPNGGMTREVSGTLMHACV